MKTISATFLALAVIALPVYGRPQAAPSKPAAAKTTGPSATATNRALLHPALLKARAPAVFKARFTTTKGDFVVEVHREWSPLGADRFYNLVKNGFYNRAHFFRVVSGFVVQFGLSPTPAVNTAWHNANIQDDPVTQTNAAGSVTFATSGPNTRTTQLFINLGDNARLDAMGFSPFGKVIEGMDVVEKLYAGYGEAPDQQRIETEGKPYLDANFPLLDSIKLARLEGVPLPPAAHKPATSSKPPSAPKNQ